MMIHFTADIHTRIHHTLCINPGQADRLQFVILEITEDAGVLKIEILNP